MHKKVLVSVAWPYVNGDIHVGHLSGYLLPADIFARYHRLRGDDVLMVSGSDCHGTPITVEADKQGLTPDQVVDKYHPNDVKLFKQYGFDYNLYTKTTTATHKRVTHEVFLDLLKNDFIVVDKMEQYYSPDDDAFLPDRYVEGVCPHCNAKDQRSDQCENCGRWLSDGELIDPVSKLTGNKVVLKETEHYFLDFEKLQSELRKFLDKNEGEWRNWVWKEADGWLREGLRKRAITRDMDWAIELPIDEIKKLPKEKQLNDFAGKKIYVWFEAVIGYLSAAQEWSESTGSEEKYTNDSGIVYRKTEDQSSDWKEWWLDSSSEHYYFMGQDNLVFHTLMWPGQLIGSQKGYTLPKNVFVNKFMNYEGKKFSKSRNWTIDSAKIAEKYGVDVVRYYIAANLPENKEANFTWEGFVDSVNNELVANLGNLINRTLKFFESKYNGEISLSDYEIDSNLQKEIDAAYRQAALLIEKGEIVNGLESIMKLARQGNKFFDENEIWQVIKTDKENADQIMMDLLNLIINLATLMRPYLPFAATELHKMIVGDETDVQVNTDIWQSRYAQEFSLKSEVKILFQKLDREKVLEEREN